MNASAVVVPLGNQHLMIYMDACRSRLGAVLMKRGHVVAYASCQLWSNEIRDATHDLELATIIFALKI